MKSIKKLHFLNFALLRVLYNFNADIVFQPEVAILCSSFILFHGRRILKSKTKFLDVKICQFEKSDHVEF